MHKDIMRHLKNHVDSIGLADVSRFLDPLGPTTVTGNVASGLQTGQGLRGLAMFGQTVTVVFLQRSSGFMCLSCTLAD